MGLNEARGNMYPFVTHTWNAIKGICPHGCSYCYMKDRVRKSPYFDRRELKTDLGTGNHIFVGSSCDMFAAAIPHDWIVDTLNKANGYSNQYLFQSKNPYRMVKYLRDNYLAQPFEVCTTIETNREYREIMRDCPSPIERAVAMRVATCARMKTYLTIEPVMDFDLAEMIQLIELVDPTQVNIGADSKGNHLPEPEPRKLRELIEYLQATTLVVRKSNLRRLLGET